jgi:hypothetical protein
MLPSGIATKIHTETPISSDIPIFKTRKRCIKTRTEYSIYVTCKIYLSMINNLECILDFQIYFVSLRWKRPFAGLYFKIQYKLLKALAKQTLDDIKSILQWYDLSLCCCKLTMQHFVCWTAVFRCTLLVEIQARVKGWSHHWEIHNHYDHHSV